MLFHNDQNKIEKIVDLLGKAQRLLVITGAGLSADSGLPTYRGIGGLYRDGATAEGIPVEQALSGHMLATNPQLSWKYMLQIATCCRNAKYNRGHEVIAAMEKYFRVCVLTQNVDGFHRDAGSKNVIDIHGDMRNLRCMNCSYRCSSESCLNSEIPPRCDKCNALMRPDVVLFGEMLDLSKTEKLACELGKGFDLVFSIGTSSLFPYIAGPVFHARQLGISIVEINPEDSQVSQIVDIKLAQRAAPALDKIWENYCEKHFSPA